MTSHHVTCHVTAVSHASSSSKRKEKEKENKIPIKSENKIKEKKKENKNYSCPKRPITSCWLIQFLEFYCQKMFVSLF